MEFKIFMNTCASQHTEDATASTNLDVLGKFERRNPKCSSVLNHHSQSRMCAFGWKRVWVLKYCTLTPSNIITSLLFGTPLS
mmetsp:Transcript_35821/g.55114  ORF Transcript_35821/g.55114 Transcript_35821/m.55114 type:complete len:82 (-) Transcript_35821:367-612(-)